MRGNRPLYILALFTLGLHLVFSARQGYFSDELYFIDLSRRIEPGYFDLGPLVPFLIRVTQGVFGDSLFALRLFPGLGHAGTVLLSGLIARELGGSLLAELLAGCSGLIAPAFLMLGGLFLTPSLEPFFWALLLYCVVAALAKNRRFLWPLAGAALGLGFLNKPTILIPSLAVLISIVASPGRKAVLDRRFAAGVAIASGLMLPNVLWQLTHEWNMIEFLRSVRQSPLAQSVSLGEFLSAPVFALHPLNALFWLGGLAWLLTAKDARAVRPLGYAFLLALASLRALGGKPYYLAGMYPFLLAAGAVAAEKSARQARLPTRRLMLASIVVVAVGGVALAPAGLPILTASETGRYLSPWPLRRVSESLQLQGVREDSEGIARDAFLKALSGAYARLSKENGGKAVTILASHYFETSWINVLGARYGLPEAISGNNHYFLRGPGDRDGEPTIAINLPDELLSSLFAKVEPIPEGPRFRFCSRPVAPLASLWPRLKSYPF